MSNILKRPQMIIIGFTSQQEAQHWLKQCGERISVLAQNCKHPSTESPFKYLLRASAPNWKEKCEFLVKRDICESKILTAEEWMTLTQTEHFEKLFPCYKFTVTNGKKHTCLCSRCNKDHEEKLDEILDFLSDKESIPQAV